MSKLGPMGPLIAILNMNMFVDFFAILINSALHNEVPEIYIVHSYLDFVVNFSIFLTQIILEFVVRSLTFEMTHC